MKELSSLFHNIAFVSESQELQSRLQTVSICLFLSCLLHKNCMLSRYLSVNTLQRQVFASVSKTVPMRKSSGDPSRSVNLKKKRKESFAINMT